MPSLKQLEVFKESFLTIGREAAVLTAQQRVPEDFPLPGVEPAAPLATETPAAPEPLSGEGLTESPEDLGLGDLINENIPEFIPPEDNDDEPPQELPESGPSGVPLDEDEVPPGELPLASEEPGGMDLAFPDDELNRLLNGDLGGETGEDPMEIDLSFPEEPAPLPVEPETPDEPLESPGGPPPEPPAEPKDPFEAFTLGSDGEEPEESKGGGGTDNFDDLFDAGSGDDGDEINLSEEDFAKLQASLENYPLNLRIACEQIIAEMTVVPVQLSSLVKLLVRGGAAEEAAALAEKITGQIIPIAKGYRKRSGEDLEAEQSSFNYIFVHKFLPLFRIAALVLLAAGLLSFLIYRLVYIPARAGSIYQLGLEQIQEGEYERGRERFVEAFGILRVKNWFYRYAEAYRDERQYLLAEEKYDQLLLWYPRDKKGALDYAALETNYLRNYSKAETILRANILDYELNDKDGLLAMGDNFLAWADIEPAHYEDARAAYARLLETNGWTDPVVERMLIYFIRTDNLEEVIPLQEYFDPATRHKISPAGLTELAGYLLDKRLEEVEGVPDANLERITGIRDLLLRAIAAAPLEPEPYYHLSRYYSRYGSASDQRQPLEQAVRNFDAALLENPRRTAYRIDAERRYAQLLIQARGFFAAEEELIKGIRIYEDALARQFLRPSPEYSRLYADLGDLEYFVKSGDMETVLRYYRRAEEGGWAPPEMLYRMASAHYYLRQWAEALDRFQEASLDMPRNRRILYALGNAAYMRGDYYTAQGYYTMLLDILEADLSRFSSLNLAERPDHVELAERLMTARNNLGAALEHLADRTGQGSYRSSALGLYTESARAWDTITRDPDTMVRAGFGDLSSPGINLAYLNTRNSLYPEPGYERQIYAQVDKDVLEPSPWEELAPAGYGLADRF
ncbi:MAG: tetratricopeptide repeat protein [Treponema sp.]|jgi:tetratricopeptide (TPR) repeat protein|nr:tetratricopeptide repeat protein [Treponema sp.]